MEPQAEQQQSRSYLFTLSLGALGVVYGDIGTSPLYALAECFKDGHGVAATPGNVLGVLSLITWSLIIVISIKYIAFVMRADNRGEGGILALMSLVRSRGGRRSRRRGTLIALGLFGAALLYGDGMITPAITVLSALEGMKVVTPMFAPYVIPLTIVFLVALFVVQKHGTAKVGAMFGPVMLIWFFTIATLGIMQIARDPHVLQAVNPVHAARFFLEHGGTAFIVLGAVFLVVTGGESLYLDMGHFGAKPIRLVWFVIVFPALLLNYYGQGAFLLNHPEGHNNPFYMMAPSWALIPLVILATLASGIASQAVISGAFSLTRQAVQLGYLPRMRIRHTSAHEIGQIYIPSINWLLMICAILLVIAFGAATNLAAAYGIAVTTTMTCTTLLLAVVARERWKWSWPAVIALTLPLAIIDFSFFGANMLKVLQGGWFPLLVGIVVFTLMTTWQRGRSILSKRLSEQVMSIDAFVKDLSRSNRIPRVPGTAIFMTRSMEGIPTTLLHNIKHNKVVHQRTILLTVDIEETSHMAQDERVEWTDLGAGIYRLELNFGFMEDPNIPATLEKLSARLAFNPMSTSYFLGRETLIPTDRPGMAIWREHLFSWMMRNASSASGFFSLPANQVIELGSQVEL